VFAGRYDHALDEKGRTMMPKRFRDRLAVTGDRSVWITNALDGQQHLEVRPNGAFAAHIEKVSKLKATPEVREYRRLYIGAAMEVEIDGAGRLLVPASLRQKIGLTDKITFVGTGVDAFEIWNPEALDQRFSDAQTNAATILDHLAEQGI